MCAKDRGDIFRGLMVNEGCLWGASNGIVY